MFWGTTPAFNFFHELNTYSEIPEELNILLVGNYDCRHILQSLSRRYRYRRVKINFFVVESALESLAKQLLLLKIAFQPKDDLGAAEKTRTFMELYGNTLVRPNIARYHSSVSAELVRLITNDDILANEMPFIKIDVKYKERDYIENLFKFWCGSDPFDIQEIWDRRVRRHLGVRYDTKMGVFDWDLNMHLHHNGGRQICSQEYRHWRATGVAFTWMECDFSKPNRSFVTGVFPNGNSYLHYGYLGDIITGPFAAYGLECEDKTFLKSTNGQNVHRATDVTERNLMQILHELETQDEYTHHKVNDYILGPAGFQLPQERVVDSYGGGFEKCVGKCFVPDDVTITFMSLSKMALMKNKEHLKNRFSVVYFGSEYLKYFDVDLVKHLALPGCLLIVENKLFNPSVRNEELQKFSEDVLHAAEPISTLAAPFDYAKDFYAKFLIKSIP